MSYLHNWDKALNVHKSILGLFRVKSSFFADDGFGNLAKVDIVRAIYFME